MNSILLLIIGIPIIEVIIMIKVGQQIGVLFTISLILLTAVIGISFAKNQGLNTIKSGLVNVYQNKLPLFELISGASIGIAVTLLIFPGFLTDFIGFILLIPITRTYIIKRIFNKTKIESDKNEETVLDGEIISKNKDEKNEL